MADYKNQLSTWVHASEHVFTPPIENEEVEDHIKHPTFLLFQPILGAMWAILGLNEKVAIKLQYETQDASFCLNASPTCNKQDPLKDGKERKDLLRLILSESKITTQTKCNGEMLTLMDSLIDDSIPMNVYYGFILLVHWIRQTDCSKQWLTKSDVISILITMCKCAQNREETEDNTPTGVFFAPSKVDDKELPFRTRYVSNLFPHFHIALAQLMYLLKLQRGFNFPWDRRLFEQIHTSENPQSFLNEEEKKLYMIVRIRFDSVVGYATHTKDDSKEGLHPSQCAHGIDCSCRAFFKGFHDIICPVKCSLCNTEISSLYALQHIKDHIENSPKCFICNETIEEPDSGMDHLQECVLENGDAANEFECSVPDCPLKASGDAIEFLEHFQMHKVDSPPLQVSWMNFFKQMSDMKRSCCGDEEIDAKEHGVSSTFDPSRELNPPQHFILRRRTEVQLNDILSSGSPVSADTAEAMFGNLNQTESWNLGSNDDGRSPIATNVHQPTDHQQQQYNQQQQQYTPSRLCVYHHLQGHCNNGDECTFSHAPIENEEQRQDLRIQQERIQTRKASFNGGRRPSFNSGFSSAVDRPCFRYYIHNSCVGGDACHFSHRELTDAQYDEVKRMYEERPQRPSFSGSVAPCRSFAHDGTCQYGDKCHFSHNVGQDRRYNRHSDLDQRMERASLESGGRPPRSSLEGGSSKPFRNVRNSRSSFDESGSPARRNYRTSSFDRSSPQKTRPCFKFHLTHNCSRGADCHYSHDPLSPEEFAALNEKSQGLIAQGYGPGTGGLQAQRNRRDSYSNPRGSNDFGNRSGSNRPSGGFMNRSQRNDDLMDGW
eukprot:TRINITY_DN5331_c0_g1_i1.p1 TRINITY_DN5331_c0_g1~~TRINITY_DN5331_c0_g1_i1.p1  ORF type:complete len:830 (-),score=242.15 TRINITY_DN5331_c0_g1_i1:774-3263(-)